MPTITIFNVYVRNVSVEGIKGQTLPKGEAVTMTTRTTDKEQAMQNAVKRLFDKEMSFRCNGPASLGSSLMEGELSYKNSLYGRLCVEATEA
jgi:hypothetical protein